MMLAAECGTSSGSFDASMIKERAQVMIVHQVGEDYPPRTTIGSFWVSHSAPSSTRGVLLGFAVSPHTSPKETSSIKAKATTSPLLTHGEMVEQLIGAGLSVSSLAEMCGVTRATVYSWQQGSAPHADKQGRIEVVFQLLTKVEKIHLPLFSKVWLRKEEGGQSLFEVLTARELSVEGFDRALSSVQHLFRKLIERSQTPRKSVATLTAETLQTGVSHMQDWSNKVAVGREIG